MLVLGAVLAFLPTSAGEDVNCGSALGTGDSGAISDAELADYSSDMRDAYAGRVGNSDYVTQCDSRVTTQRLIAFPIFGGGALGLLFLGLTSAYMRELTQSPAPSGP